MNIWMKMIPLALAVTFTFTGPATADSINLGNKESEQAHKVSVKRAEVVGESYPERILMAVRASAFQEEHKPHRAVDGDPETAWRVKGAPPEGLNLHWLDLKFNQTMKVNKIAVRWLGNQPYQFDVVAQTGDDFQLNAKSVHQDRSDEHGQNLVTYRLSQPVPARSLRIRFQPGDENTVRGIREIRVGGLNQPRSYPLMRYDDPPVVKVDQRPLFVNFEQEEMKPWTQFNLKRPLADGGSARRILPTDELDGGYIDFTIDVHPQKQNWITLKTWEFHQDVMTDRGNLIALEAFVHNPDRNRRWLIPEIVTEYEIDQDKQKNWNYRWYDLEKPGRWVYVSYPLHRDITRGREQIRLRLRGIGNKTRNHPMQSPAPPVYTIRSHTGGQPLPAMKGNK